MVAASAISTPVAPMAEPMPMMRAQLVAQHGEERGAVRADAHSRGEYGVDGERECHHGDHRHRLQPARPGTEPPVEPGATEDAGREPDHEQPAGQRVDQRAPGRPRRAGATPTSMAATTTATTCSAVCVAASPPDVVSSA